MKPAFEKQEFNEQFYNENHFVELFKKLGFTPSKVQISYSNGFSAYITLNVNVLNEGKMWNEVFVYEGRATIKVRISDHASNLEKICGGVSGNALSFEAFKKLVDNNIIN